MLHGRIFLNFKVTKRSAPAQLALGQLSTSHESLLPHVYASGHPGYGENLNPGELYVWEQGIIRPIPITHLRRARISLRKPVGCTHS